MSGNQETINLNTLEPQQLMQVKKQLDEELQHLSTSFSQLRAAQNKFRDCLRCVQDRSTATTESASSSSASAPAATSVLVPLTNSLYVKGELSNTDSVLVDVGTGFLIEKKLNSAEKFYQGKVDEIGENLKSLEAIIQRKQMNSHSIEDVLRQKMMAAQQGAQS